MVLMYFVPPLILFFSSGPFFQVRVAIFHLEKGHSCHEKSCPGRFAARLICWYFRLLRCSWCSLAPRSARRRPPRGKSARLWGGRSAWSASFAAPSASHRKARRRSAWSRPARSWGPTDGKSESRRRFKRKSWSLDADLNPYNRRPPCCAFLCREKRRRAALVGGRRRSLCRGRPRVEVRRKLLW